MYLFEKRKVREIIKDMEGFKLKQHYHNDEDNYYSCPMHPEFGGDLAEQNQFCNCSMEGHNKQIDEFIDRLNKLLNHGRETK